MLTLVVSSVLLSDVMPARLPISKLRETHEATIQLHSLSHTTLDLHTYAMEDPGLFITVECL